MVETGFADIVQKIAGERGKDIFLAPRKLKSFLLDYTKNEYKKESSLLLAMLEADCVKYIKMAENIDKCKQFLVKRLEDDNSLSPAKSGEMLDLLFVVLRDEEVRLPVKKNTSKHKKLKKTDSIVGLGLKNAQAHLDSGLGYYLNGLYGEAIADFTEAVRFDPKNSEAYTYRGRAYMWKELYEEATADFTEAVRLDPKNSEVYTYRGDAYMWKELYDEAIADLTEAAKIKPGNRTLLDSLRRVKDLKTDAPSSIPSSLKNLGDKFKQVLVSVVTEIRIP